MPTLATKLVIEGEAEYKRAVQNCNNELRAMKSELALVTAEYKENANSIEALSAKGEALGKMYETQAKRVEAVETVLESAKKTQEEVASAHAEAAARLKENAEALGTLDDATKQAGEEWNKYAEKLKDAEERLKELEKTSESNTEEQEKAQKKIDAAKKKLQELSESTGGAAETAGKLVAENKALSQEYEASNKVVDKANQAVNKYQTELNTAKANLINLDVEIKTNNQYLDEAKSSADGCATSIDQYGKEVKDAGEQSEKAGIQIEDVGGKIKIAGAVIAAASAAIAGAAVAVVKKLGELAQEGAAYADDVMTTATATGIATDKLQEYMYAAELVDVSVDTLTGTMAKNIRSMKAAQDGTALSVEAYEKLGVEVVDTNGKLRDGDTVYWEVIDALGKMKNETERDAIAMQLLGRSAQDINPLISAGAETMGELAEKAHEAGYILSEETLTAYGQLDDAIQYLSKNTDAAKNALGQVLLPVLTDLADYGGQKIAEFTARVNEAGGDIDKIIEIAGDMLPEVFDKLLEYVPQITQLATSMITGFAAAFVENVPTLVTTLTKVATDTIAEFLPILIAQLPDMLTAVTDGAVDIAEGIISNLPALIHGAVETAIRLIVEGLPDIIGGLTEVTVSLFESLPSMLAGVLTGIGDAIVGIFDPTKREFDTMLKAMTEKASAAKDNIAEINEAYQDSVAGTEAAAQTADKYIVKLAELEKQGLNTKETQEEYRKTVDLLNQLIPELNIQIDEQTGLVAGGTKALEENTKAWRENAIEQALLEKRKALLSEYIELQLETKENEIKQQQAQEAHDAILNKRKEIMQDIEQIAGRTVNAEEIYGKGLRDLVDEVRDANGAEAASQIELLTNEYSKWIGSLNITAEELENCKSAVAESTAAQEDYAAEMQITDDALDALAEQLTKTTGGVDSNSDATKKNSDASEENRRKKEAAEAVEKALDDALEKTSKRLDEMTAATSLLSSALEEQKDAGELSISTIQRLSEAGYGLALQIDEETGEVTLNKAAYIELAKAKLDEQIVAAQADRRTAINALTDNYDAVKDLARGYYDAAIASYELDAAQVGDIKAMDAQIAALKKLRDEVGKTTETTRSTRSTSTTKQKTQAEKDLEAFRKAKKQLDHERNMDIVDEETYYRDLVKLRDKYLTADANIDEYRSVTESVYKYECQVAEESFKALEENAKEKEKLIEEEMKAYEAYLKDLYAASKEELDKIKATYDEVVKEQQELTKKLQSYGGLQIGEDETAIAHVQSQIDAIKGYENAIKGLRELGLSDEHLTEIMALGIDDATEYAKQILSMSEEEQEQYKTLYEEKLRLTKEVAQNLYKEELETLQKDYNTLLEQVYETTGSKAYDSGVEMIDSISAGMKAEQEKLLAQAKALADEVRAAFAGSIAPDVAAMTPIYPTIIEEPGDITRSEQTAATVGAVGTLVAQQQHTGNSGGTLVIPLEVNGRELARATIEDYRNVDDQSPRVEVENR